MRKTLLKISLLVLLLFQLSCTSSVLEEDNKPLLNTIDPGVLTARLDNGFEYYLRSTNGAADNEQIEVRLVVKAGALHETRSQRGYAHLVEHMAYRGTEHFSGADIEGLLDDAGLRWGVDVNATTHYGATIYRFTLHESDSELLPRLFDLMSEWLTSVQFDADALEREKRIIEAEWRERYAKRNYVVDPVTAVAFSGSQYAASAPVGNLENIRGATTLSVKQFWKTHYRPDNAALVVTGISQPWKLEPLINTFFELPDLVREPVSGDEYQISEVQGDVVRAKFLSYLNPESSLPQLAVNFISTAPGITSRVESAVAAGFQDQLLFKVFTHLVRNRLAKTRYCNAVQVETSLLESGQTIEHVKLSLTEIDLLPCLSALSAAVDSVVLTALTDEEFNEFHQLFEAIVKDAVYHYRNRNAAEMAESLVEMVVGGEPSISVWDLQAQLNQVVERVDRKTLNEMISNIINTHDVVYSVIGNENPPPTAAQMQASVEIDERKIPHSGASRLVNGRLHPDQSKISVPVLDITEGSVVKLVESGSHHQWRLQNGAMVTLIEDDRFDYVAVTAMSRGGFAQRDTEFSRAAYVLPQFIATNGVGGYISSTLRNEKSNNEIALEPFVDATSHGINASSRSEDLPLLLTLIDGYFQEPMIIEPASSSLLRKLNDQKPGARWHQLAGNHRVGHPLSDRPIELTTDDFKQVQRQLFSSPSDFSFVFIGSLDPNELQRELNRLAYNGTFKRELYSHTDRFSVNQVSMLNHRSEVTDVIFNMACDSLADGDGGQYRQWLLLADIITNRLRMSIRERRGLAYEIESKQFVANTPTASNYLLQQYRYSVAPQFSGESTLLMANVLEELASNGVTESEFQRSIAREKRNQFLRRHSAVNMANTMATEWLAMGKVSIFDQSTFTLSGINELVECAYSDRARQVVLKSIDTFNSTQPVDSALHQKEQNAFQGSAEVEQDASSR